MAGSSGRKELLVSLYQASILLLFNTTDTLSLSEISEVPPPPRSQTEATEKTNNSSGSRESGEIGSFPALKLTDLYRTPSVSS